MAGGWELFKSGPVFPSHLEIEDAPLELYRTHEHQDRPDVLQRGIDLFQAGYQEYWLPQRMGQQQWKRDDEGAWKTWDDSAQGYIQASMAAPLPPARGGSTTRFPTVRHVRRVDPFQQVAIDLMQRGIVRYDPAPEIEPHYALSRNLSAPQLLPEDMDALDAYEESAVSAAERSKGADTRRCINEMRARDAAIWALAFQRGGR